MKKTLLALAATTLMATSVAAKDTSITTAYSLCKMTPVTWENIYQFCQGLSGFANPLSSDDLDYVRYNFHRVLGI